MKLSSFLKRLPLVGVIVLVGVLFHQRVVTTLPKVENAFEIWLNRFEDDILNGNAREVKVTVAVKSRAMNRTWMVEEPSQSSLEKHLVLRVLQLIREGDLLESTEQAEEFVLVDVAGEEFKKKAILSWEAVQSSLPATNLFVLLENVRPEPAVPALSEDLRGLRERKGSDENKG